MTKREMILWGLVGTPALLGLNLATMLIFKVLHGL